MNGVVALYPLSLAPNLLWSYYISHLSPKRGWRTEGRTDGRPLIFSLLTVSVRRRPRHRTQAGVSLRRLQHRCKFRSGVEPCAGAGKPFHNTVHAAGETLSFNGPFSFEIVSTKWKMWAYRVFSLLPCAYFLRRSMYNCTGNLYEGCPRLCEIG